jgi:hypothetical protein
VKNIRPILLIALAFCACSGDSPTSIPSSALTSGGQTSAQGNQNPLPVEPAGVCAGKETFKSVTGDVKYCVLSSDLLPQGNLCHFVKPEDPPILRHRIGVVTGPVGAYLKAPIGFFGPENDCGAVPELNGGTGLILIEEADATGGAEIPPNSEKVLTFAFTRDASDCGRVQSVGDLLTQNGTSLKVGGFVLNYSKGCCTKLDGGSGLPPNDEPLVDPELQFPLHVYEFGFDSDFIVPAGWSLKINAGTTRPAIPASRKGHPPVSTTTRTTSLSRSTLFSGFSGSSRLSGFSLPDREVRSQAYDSLLATIGICIDLESGVPSIFEGSSSDGSLRVTKQFATEHICFLILGTANPSRTNWSLHKCPGLLPDDYDEGPLFEGCGCPI